MKQISNQYLQHFRLSFTLAAADHNFFLTKKDLWVVFITQPTINILSLSTMFYYLRVTSLTRVSNKSKYYPTNSKIIMIQFQAVTTKTHIMFFYRIVLVIMLEIPVSLYLMLTCSPW